MLEAKNYTDFLVKTRQYYQESKKVTYTFVCKCNGEDTSLEYTFLISGDCLIAEQNSDIAREMSSEELEKLEYELYKAAAVWEAEESIVEITSLDELYELYAKIRELPGNILQKVVATATNKESELLEKVGK